MSLNIVTRKGNKHDKLIRLFLISIVAFIILSIILHLIFTRINIGILMIPTGLGILGATFTPLFFKRYKFTGNIEFLENRIQINNSINKVIPFNELTKLTFYFRGIKGDSFDLAPLGISSFGFKDGAGNILEITTRNKVTFVNLFINSNMEFRRLKIWIEEMEEKGIPSKIINRDYYERKFED